MKRFSASLRQFRLPIFLLLLLSFPQISQAYPDLSSSNSSTGYISDLSADGFYRWNPDRFPLKVYMTPGSSVDGYKEDYPAILKNCFNEWARISNGKLSWKPVNNPKSADIVVKWSADAEEGQRGTEAGKTKTFALYDTQTNWGEINRAEMRLLTRLPDRNFRDDEVRKAYLHEVGHALGIAGHSSDQNDIMFFAVRKGQSGELSTRDVATINFLYADKQEPSRKTALKKAPVVRQDAQTIRPANCHKE